MNHRRLSVSSWSLHRTLGSLPITDPADKPNPAPPGALPLLDLPREIAEHGIQTLEICHFHFPSTDDDFVSELCLALEASGVELWSLLIDGGDLNGEHAARDFDWIRGWIEVAGKLGARNARVVAGQGAPTEENLVQSIASLEGLVEVADSNGVRLMTENWFDTLGSPDAVHRVFADLSGNLDLCLDFGNWDKRPHKYADLASIARYATSCHARADFKSPDELDETDFRRCLKLTVDADFHGPYTLIPSGSSGDEWAALEVAASVARDFCE
jgi:hypothetical protein